MKTKKRKMEESKRERKSENKEVRKEAKTKNQQGKEEEGEKQGREEVYYRVRFLSILFKIDFGPIESVASFTGYAVKNNF